MKKKTHIHKEISALFKMAENRGMKILPHSEEIEKEVLGIMLLNEFACDIAFEILGFATGEDVPFYSQKNRMLFEVMRAIYQTKQHPNLAFVIPYIQQRGLDEEIYSRSELVGLQELITTTANIAEFSRELLYLHAKRKFILKCEILALKGYEGETDLESLMNDADETILEIRTEKKTNDIVKFGNVDLSESAEFKTGWKTGIFSIDELIHRGKGFQGGEYIIIAARPSVGKTTFGININAFEALQGNAALFVSLEMTTKQVSGKFFEYFSGAPFWKLDPKYDRAGWSEEEWTGKLRYEKNRMLYPIYIDDNSFLNPLAIRSQIIRCKRKHEIKAVFVDYLELVKPVERYANSREREVSENSQFFKSLAKELNIPIFILSQLNRNMNQRANKRPILSDLRMSGSLEQDADTVIFLHDPIMSASGNPEKIRDVEWIVAKNRLGGLGNGMLKFNTEVSKFEHSDMPTFAETEEKETALAF